MRDFMKCSFKGILTLEDSLRIMFGDAVEMCN